MNKRIVVTIVCIVLALATVAGVVLMCIPKGEKIPDETKEAGTQPVADTTATETDETDNKPLFEDEHTEREPTHVIEFDDGNEIYLDEDVINKLSELEAEGNEDLVNAMLDGTITLINAFADKGYSLRAIRQIQRFYFAFYNELKEMEYEDIISKLTECFTAEGVFEDSFALDAQRLFGFDTNTDYSYIFDMGDSE